MKDVKLVDGYEDEKGNKVFITDIKTDLKDVSVVFKGSNNILIIDASKQVFSKLVIEFTSDEAICVLGKVSKLKGKIRIGYHSLVMMGDNITTTNPFYICCTEQTQTIVGDDCMLSTNNHIRTDDAHAIYDVETGKRLNKSSDIIIGAHSWIAYASKIYGGSIIGDGCIVGTGSIVKGHFANNCTIVGSPARIIRRNVAWERPNLATTKPWIKDNAEALDKTLQFWNKTDDYQKIPNLGVGVERLYSCLQRYCPNSIWQIDNYVFV